MRKNMKKTLLFITIFFLGIIGVSAADTNDQFYAEDWIPNIYIDKVKNGIIYYKQARFIKGKNSKDIAYCVEPFEEMKTNSNYSGYSSDYSKHLGISDSTWKKISQIAYYGYGYANHTDQKWYAITQVMIWRELDKSAQFYFTDTLNGNKITKYDDEIKEINNLVSSANILPSFANKTYDFSINSNNKLVDNNSVLSLFNYSIDDDSVQLEKNSDNLIINTTIETSATIAFRKSFNNYNKKTIVFTDGSYQNLMLPGNIEDITFKLNINVSGGRIKVTKIDFDSGEKSPKGEGALIGSKYEIYDSNNNIIDTLTINEEYEAISKLLPFGKYIIKETESMKGYLLDTEEYEAIIDKDNLSVEFTLNNKAIKSNIEIYKYFDEKIESGISFEIYDKDNNLIDTVTTDENGKILKELYYGTYKFHQLNTTKNYLCVDDFQITIDENSEQTIRLDLKDEKFSSKLIITKKDNKTGNIIREETIFKIYDTIKNEYIKINNSDELKTKNGILIIEKIYAGIYELEEFKAPKGYKKLQNKIKFIIDEDNVKQSDKLNSIYEIDVEDEIIEVDVPNTYKDIDEKDVYLIEDKKKKLTIFS